MRRRFDGKVALVTGGGSGLGAAIGRRLAAEGARVVLADRDGAAAEEVASECDGRGEFLAVDVTDTPSVEAMVAAMRDRHGRIDVLVNSAGRGQRPSSFDVVVDEDLDDLLAVNVKSVYVVTRAALPLLTAAPGSVVVNMASSSGLRPRPGYAAYAATKGAVAALTKALAVELADRRVRVVALCPAAADTPMLREFMGGEDAAERRAAIAESMPLGRLVRTDEVAAAAAWVASDEAAMVTGELISIDGGRGL